MEVSNHIKNSSSSFSFPSLAPDVLSWKGLNPDLLLISAICKDNREFLSSEPKPVSINELLGTWDWRSSFCKSFENLFRGELAHVKGTTLLPVSTLVSSSSSALFWHSQSSWLECLNLVPRFTGEGPRSCKEECTILYKLEEELKLLCEGLKRLVGVCTILLADLLLFFMARRVRFFCWTAVLGVITLEHKSQW